MRSTHASTNFSSTAYVIRSRPALQLRQLCVLLLVAMLSCLSLATAMHPVDTAPAFSTAESQAEATSKTPNANLKYRKQIRVGARVGSSATAITALVLDLPGQVFVSCAPKALMEPINNDGPLFGEINVYASSDELANSAVPMFGFITANSNAKLTVASRSQNISATNGEFMVTEIVLLQKSALKKLIANGAADVIIGNDVLYTKQKADYPHAFARSLREASSASSAANLTTLTHRNDMHTGFENLTSYVLYSPTVTTTPENVALAIDAASGVRVFLNRIDSDLLPDGAIGHLMLPHDLASATIARTDAVDTLRINTSSVSVAVAEVYLVPSVTVTNLSAPGGAAQFTDNLNTTTSTVSDASVVVLLNGTGNIVVSASSSAVYVDRADFRVYGTGVLQATFDEIFGAMGVAALVESGVGLVAESVASAVTVTPHQACLVTRKMGVQTTAFGGSHDPRESCPVLLLPKKTGRAGDTFQGPSTKSAAVAMCRTTQQALSVAFVALIAVFAL